MVFKVTYTSPWDVCKTSGCWLWNAGKDKDGYGKVKRNGRSIRAHRMMYESHRGPIPDGKLVLHSCDTPACVNPDHLSIGDHQENHSQRGMRGRTAKGEASGRSKYSDALIEQIRAERIKEGTSTLKLSRKYGVSVTHVKRIVKGAGRC